MERKFEEKTLTKDTLINGKVIKEGTVIKYEVSEIKESKKVKEAMSDLSFGIVYVNAMDSTTIFMTEKNNDVKKIRDEAYKNLLKQDPDASDDFWIDAVWAEDGVPEASIDWKEVIAPGGVLDQSMVDFVFESPEEFGVKVQFYMEHIDSRLNPSKLEEQLEEITVYDASGEDWVEGNFGSRFPEDWLFEYTQNSGNMTDFIETNWLYFEEPFARIASDDEANGDFTSDNYGQMFVYR